MKNCTKIVIFQEFFKAQQETCGGKELVIKSAVQLSCGVGRRLYIWKHTEALRYLFKGADMFHVKGRWSLGVLSFNTLQKVQGLSCQSV